MNRFFGLIAVGIFALAAHSAGTAGTDSTAVLQTPTDAEILQILKTTNQAEVNAAEVAISRAQSKEVKEFAKKLKQEHKQNTQKAEKLAKQINATAKDHPRAAEIQQNTQSKINAMKKTKGMQFDSVYVNTQVAMHEQLLADLNKTLIPNAKNDQLKSFLETTKNHVQEHLDTAKKLQASLTKWE